MDNIVMYMVDVGSLVVQFINILGERSSNSMSQLYALNGTYKQKYYIGN